MLAVIIAIVITGAGVLAWFAYDVRRWWVAEGRAQWRREMRK
jgi:hypothetical protein